MYAKRQFFLTIGVLLIVVSGCNSRQQPTSQTTAQPTTPLTSQATPQIATGTAIASSITAAPTALSITSLQMMDAKQGWAKTNANRLLLTSDGGQTWVDRTPEGQVWSEGAFFLDSQTAWLPIFLKDSSRNGLLHTSDGGQTWTQYPYGPGSNLQFTDALNGWAEEADPGAGNVYYTLSETHDGGASWKPIPVTQPRPETGLPPGTVHLCNMCNDSFYYDPGRMIIVYGDMASMQPGGSVRMQVSFDLGKTWQMQNLPLPKENADAVVAPDRPTFFSDKNGLLPVRLVKMNSDGSFVYQRLAFYATQDGGATWSLRSGVIDTTAGFGQLQIVSAQDLFAICGTALCASHDGAQTWQTMASNLDFSQTDTRSIALLDFLDASTGWTLLTENERSTLYKTTDGGKTWDKLTPSITASAPVTIQVDTRIPTPTLIPTATPEPTVTPNVAFDSKANAYRIRFSPNATWVEINDAIAAKTTRRYVLSAMQGQIMSVSILQGPAALSVEVAGADKKLLSDSRVSSSFWRGNLPSTQDYILTVASYAATAFTMRVSINPPGQAAQNFSFSDKKYLVALRYTDEFAPILAEPPAVHKGTPLLTLTFIDPAVYFPTTNLGDTSLMLNVAEDPAIVAACTQPSANPIETVTGQVTINGVSFTRAEVNVGAAGNFYDQVSYRTVINDKCFEVIFLFHSMNIGSYSPGGLVEFDRAALLKKFEAVLDTFLAK